MTKLLFIALLLISGSCTHVKTGWFVKAQDGKIYRLIPQAADESYYLEEVDTTSLKFLIK